jgi:tRNA pseudouridine(38-40) synthase
VPTWKLTIEYDGSRYSGWQDQTNARTIAGELRQAAEEIFGGPVEIMGAGRTDAGVHAAAQVAHLRADARRRIAPAEIKRRLNEIIPFDIAVLNVADVSPDSTPVTTPSRVATSTRSPRARPLSQRSTSGGSRSRSTSR